MRFPTMKFPVKTVTAAVALAVSILVGVEGLSTKPYEDSGGVWTICYGQTGKDVTAKTPEASKEKCFGMLNTEAADTAERITPFLPAILNSNQLAALISFCYNVGVQACRDSTMFKLINQGKMELVPAQFARWVFVKGKDCRVRKNNCYGLVERRQVEMMLFMKPASANPSAPGALSK
jgi:lysozyme